MENVDRKPRGYWDYERCKDDAINFKTRAEFYKNSGSAYEVARKNNWLDEFFPK